MESKIKGIISNIIGIGVLYYQNKYVGRKNERLL